MRRRTFIAALGGAAAWPRLVIGQPFSTTSNIRVNCTNALWGKASFVRLADDDRFC